jgi:tetratricopeptide (TPR) repeat protein
VTRRAKLSSGEEAAKSELELAIARRPNAALAHYYLAAVYQGLGRLELAEIAAERAIELSPPPSRAPLDSSEPAPGVAARHLLAEIRYGRGEAVEPVVRDVLAIEPENVFGALPPRAVAAAARARR